MKNVRADVPSRHEVIKFVSLLLALDYSLVTCEFVIPPGVHFKKKVAFSSMYDTFLSTHIAKRSPSAA